MSINYSEIIYQINCLVKDTDSIYHKAALKLKMSDTVMFILYLVYENDGKYLLNNIQKETNISKQTLNSAIRKLEKEEIIYLEKIDGKKKNICFTNKGKEYADKTIAHLFKAECNAIKKWNNDDIKQYLNLMKQYNQNLKEEIKNM